MLIAMKICIKGWILLEGNRACLYLHVVPNHAHPTKMVTCMRDADITLTDDRYVENFFISFQLVAHLQTYPEGNFEK